VKKIGWVLLAAFFVALTALAIGWPSAEATTPAVDPVVAAHTWNPQDHTYEGGRTGCRRCHIKQWRSWEATAHATAFETLPEEGRSDSTCLKCHATGHGAPTGFTSVDETPDLAGVTCEGCHGPGSDYKDREVMQDLDASIAAGLIIPDEASCVGCHNTDCPNFSGSFDYEAALADGVHEIGS
jgi:hypothetical protein